MIGWSARLYGPIIARNSRRVSGLSRKHPSRRLVTIFTPVF